MEQVQGSERPVGAGVDWAAVFAAMPTAYLVTDADLRVVAANEAYLRTLSRPREELLGRYVLDAFPAAADAVDENGRNPLQQSCERARDTGRPDRLALLDHPVTDPDGRTRRRSWSSTCTPLPGPDGPTALLLLRVEDVTDHHAPARADEAARRLSEALQRSLLSEPPDAPGLDVAVRYRPAGEGAEVGGDWYDAFVLEDGDTLLVVGDVTGHDRSAAAAMAQVRNLLRGVAQTVAGSSARVLGALDRAMRNLAVDTLATAVLVEVRRDPDPRTGDRVAEWSNAGHPPPLLLLPDGSATLLDSESDLLLGLQPWQHRSDQQVRLPAGSTLLLYTDGLLERRGEGLEAGLERLRRTAEELAGQPVEALCDGLLATLPERLEDDVALLAVSASPVHADATASAASPDEPSAGRAPLPGPARSLVLPADPAVVRRARGLVEQMCRTAAVDEDTCHTAVLLTSETVTNAIVHGRSDATLTVSAGPGVVRVEVGDEDSRRPLLAERDPGALGGRGLEIVRMLAQRWGVRDEDRGKVVWFEVGDA